MNEDYLTDEEAQAEYERQQAEDDFDRWMSDESAIQGETDLW